MERRVNMGRLKSAMMDVGYEAMENGIQQTADKHSMSEDDVKFCILFACAYDGTWEQFVAEGHMQQSKLLH